MEYEHRVEELLFLDRPYREIKELVAGNSALLNPEFGADKPFNDWRNFVPFGLRQSWATLSQEERTMCYVMSVNAAKRYAWE